MLTFRKPAPLFTFLGWLFSGPLNPAALLIFILLFFETSEPHEGIGAALFLIGAPAAIGMIFVLLRLKRKPVTIGRIFIITFLMAVLVAALFPLMFLVIPMIAEVIGALGSGNPASIFDFPNAGDTVTAIFMLPLLGVTYGLIFALPAALLGALALRLITFRKTTGTE